MIGRLNHVAFAVPTLQTAVRSYAQALGAHVSDPQDLRDHGVRVVFVTLSNTKIELLEPLGEDSPIAQFLQKNPVGGMHHVCYEVSDIAKAIDRLTREGMRIVGDGMPKIGAHGLPVLFLHPKDMHGVLTELEEVTSSEYVAFH